MRGPFKKAVLSLPYPLVLRHQSDSASLASATSLHGVPALCPGFFLCTVLSNLFASHCPRLFDWSEIGAYIACDELDEDKRVPIGASLGDQTVWVDEVGSLIEGFGCLWR